VSATIRKAGSYSSGMPTVETRHWRRMVANLRRFGEKER
jgi:UDP-3-O-[3-hydroxymyristoyl] glucosamine N-acyltransferase